MRTRQKRYPSEVSDGERQSEEERYPSEVSDDDSEYEEERCPSKVSDDDSQSEEEEPQQKQIKPSVQAQGHKDQIRTFNDPRTDPATTRLIAHDPKEGLLWLDEGAKDDRGQKVGKWIRAVYHNDIRPHLIAKASRNGILKYEVPRSRGSNEDDVTSYHPEQDIWRSEREYWNRIRDDILHRLNRSDRDGNDYLGRYYLQPLHRWFEGDRLVIDEGARPLVKLPDLPDTISSQIEGWLMAAWLRLDDRISRRDIWARIPRQYIDSNSRKMGGIQLSALGNRYNRFMQDQGLPAWGRKKDSCPLILDRLPRLCKDNNSTRPECGGRPLDDAERYIVDNYGKGQHLAKAGNRRISDKERSRRAARTRKRIKTRRIKDVDTFVTNQLGSLSQAPARSSTRSTELTGGPTIESSIPYRSAPATTGASASKQSHYFAQSTAPQPPSTHGVSSQSAYPNSLFSNPATALLPGHTTHVEPSDSYFGFNFQPDPALQLLARRQNGNTQGLGFGGNVYFPHGTGFNDFDYDSFINEVNNGYGPNKPLYEYADREQLPQTFSTGDFGPAMTSTGYNTFRQGPDTWQSMQSLNNQWSQNNGFSQLTDAASQQSTEMPNMNMSVDTAWDATEEVVRNVPNSAINTGTNTEQNSSIAHQNQDANEHNPDPIFTPEFMAEMDEMINAPLTRQDFIQQDPAHTPAQATSTNTPDEGTKKRKRAPSDNAAEEVDERPVKRQAIVDSEEPSDDDKHITWRSTGRKTVPGYARGHSSASEDAVDNESSRADGIVTAVDGTSSDDAEGETDDELPQAYIDLTCADGNSSDDAEGETDDELTPTYIDLTRSDGTSSDDAEGETDDELPQAYIDLTHADGTSSDDAEGETDDELPNAESSVAVSDGTSSDDAKGETDDGLNDDMASLFEEERNDTSDDTASNANDSTTEANNDFDDERVTSEHSGQSSDEEPESPNQSNSIFSMACVIS